MLRLLNQLSNSVKTISLSIIIVIIFILAFGSLRNQFQQLYDQNQSYLIKIDKKRIELFEGHKNGSIQDFQKEILRNKIAVLQNQREQHLNLMGILLRNNYALLTLFPIISGLTGLFAFLLLQRGWKESNIYIKSTFLTMAFLSGVTGIFPEVYQQESNLQSYTEAYVSYSKLQKKLYSYQLTAPLLDKDTLLFQDFLLQINQKEIELFDYNLDLEKREITQETFELGN